LRDTLLPKLISGQLRRQPERRRCWPSCLMAYSPPLTITPRLITLVVKSAG
jgi:hypothetical protein